MTFFKQIIPALGGLLILLWISSPLRAQNSKEADTSQVYQLGEIIVSAGKYEQSPQSVGRNVTVISQEEIRNSAYTSVSELLAQQQSVHIIGAGQTPGSLQQGFIRNANAHHSVVLIDGIRISDPSTANNAIDLSELTLTGIKRIEIVRGSHSTLYGSSAIGGVINIVTKKEGAAGFNTNLETQHGRFGPGTYSTNNALYTSYTAENGFYANVGLDQQFVSGMDATVDTISNPGAFNPQDQDDFEKVGLTGKAGYKNEDFEVYATYRRKDQKVDADQGAYVDDSNAYTQFKRNFYGYGAGVSLSKNVHLQLNGAYSNLQRDFVNDSSLVSADGSYDGRYVETNARGGLWKNELKWVIKGENVKLVSGVSASRQKMSIRNYVYSRFQNSVYENTTDLDSLNIRESVYSGYVHADVNGGLITEDLAPFSLVLGGRYVNHNAFGGHFTYEVNPKVDLGQGTMIYGSLTTGFNAPSLYQLHHPVSGGFTTRGNPHLEPEKSRSYELGWKQTLNSDISLQLSVFKTRVRDVIEYVYLWDGSTPINQLSGRYPDSDFLGDTYVNASSQEVKGIEASLLAPIIHGLSIQGNISLTRSVLTFDEDAIDQEYTGGNHVQVFESGEFVEGQEKINGLSRRPQLRGFINLSYRPSETWRLEFDSRYVGRQYDVFYSSNLGPPGAGALDRSRVSGYNVSDFSIRYRMTHNIMLTARVENIFNTDYTEIRGYRTKGRGLYLKASFSL